VNETRRRYTVAHLTEYPCPHCGSSAFATGNSWMEAADVPVLVGQAELTRLRAFALLVSDLDRNRNGRHEGDVDSGEPTGVSQGNPSMPTGAWIGTTMSGHQIVVPPRNLRHDPEAWIGGPDA